MENFVSQDQILKNLKGYAQVRGKLRRFCIASNLPYGKVWKFTNGETKSLSMEFGKQLAESIKKFSASNSSNS